MRGLELLGQELIEKLHSEQRHERRVGNSGTSQRSQQHEHVPNRRMGSLNTLSVQRRHNETRRRHELRLMSHHQSLTSYFNNYFILIYIWEQFRTPSLRLHDPESMTMGPARHPLSHLVVVFLHQF